MDTISVISCNINLNKVDHPINTNKFISNWFLIKNKFFFLKSKIVPLNKLKDWKYTNQIISHKAKKHFQ